MSEAPSFRMFFADGTRTFRLTPDLIRELEITTGRGIAGLCRSVFRGDFRHVEIVEPIRLALIGGGESPERAAQLTHTYAANRPIEEVLPLAIAVLETVFFGAPKPTDDGGHE